MSDTGIAAVVFDLDDTLVLERDYVRSGFAAVARRVEERYGVRDFFDLAWCRFLAGDRGRIFDDALRAAGVAPDAARVAELVEFYRHHEPTLALVPDAADCLAALDGRIALGLITDGPLASQQAKLRALSFASRFQSLICTDALGHGYHKPDPRAFQLTEEALRLPPSRCVYVADNPAKDFIAPRARGWRSVRVRRPEGVYRDTPVAPDGEPEHTLEDLRGLSALLAVLGLPAAGQ